MKFYKVIYLICMSIALLACESNQDVSHRVETGLNLSSEKSTSQPIEQGQLVYVEVDNPTSKQLKLKFNGSIEMVLNAKSHKSIQLKEGPNEIAVNQGSPEIVEIVQPAQFKRLLLNPSKRNYIKEKVVYITDRMKKSGRTSFDNHVDTIIVNGKKLIGLIEHVKGDLIIEDWNFAPWQMIPDELSTTYKKYDIRDFSRLKTKLHRESDFLTEIEKGLRNEYGQIQKLDLTDKEVLKKLGLEGYDPKYLKSN